MELHRLKSFTCTPPFSNINIMKKCFLVFRALVVCKVNITFSLQNKNILYGVIEIQILKKNYIQILEGKLIMLLQKQSTN